MGTLCNNRRKSVFIVRAPCYEQHAQSAKVNSFGCIFEILKFFFKSKYFAIQNENNSYQNLVFFKKKIITYLATWIFCGFNFLKFAKTSQNFTF